jgi:hypothetical protein
MQGLQRLGDRLSGAFRDDKNTTEDDMGEAKRRKQKLGAKYWEGRTPAPAVNYEEGTVDFEFGGLSFQVSSFLPAERIAQLCRDEGQSYLAVAAREHDSALVAMSAVWRNGEMVGQGFVFFGKHDGDRIIGTEHVSAWRFFEDESLAKIVNQDEFKLLSGAAFDMALDMSMGKAS